MATPRAILASVRTAAARPRVAASAAPRFPSPSASFARGLASAVEQRPAKQWTRDEIQEVYDTPLMELIFRAVRPVTRASVSQPLLLRLPIPRR